MAEVVESFPPRQTQAADFWRQWADGQVWKLTEADWKARYKNVESARIGGQHFGKQHGYKSRVQSWKDPDTGVHYVFCQFARRGQEGDANVRVIEGGNGRRRRPATDTG